MASQAVTDASNLNNIGFSEFTAKLITDTFDAIVAANLRQTEAYIDLVSQLSKSLSDYINDTRDDIGGAEIMRFLASALPPELPSADSAPSRVVKGGTLTAADVPKLNNAIAIVGTDGTNSNVLEVREYDLKTSAYDEILELVANRLAANKYTFLQQMVKMGMLRLVVERGRIETRLTFRTNSSHYSQRNASYYSRSESEFRGSAGTGPIVSLFCNASASTRNNQLSVFSASAADRDVQGSQVQIYGSVVIDFKTDYQPLA